MSSSDEKESLQPRRPSAGSEEPSQVQGDDENQADADCRASPLRDIDDTADATSSAAVGDDKSEGSDSDFLEECSDDSPSLPPQMMQFDEEEDDVKGKSGKSSQAKHVDVEELHELEPPVPPCFATDVDDAQRQKIRKKHRNQDGDAPSTPSPDMHSAESNVSDSNREDDSNEARPDEVIPTPTTPSTPSTRPPPPSMLPATNDETSYAPLFYPAEAYLVPDSDGDQDQGDEEQPPLAHAVPMVPQPSFWRRHKSKIGCGVLFVVAAIAAAATAGAVIGGSSKSSGDDLETVSPIDAAVEVSDGLEKENTQVSSTSHTAKSPMSPIADPPTILPSTSSTRPTESPTHTNEPSLFPTFEPTMSPTSCPEAATLNATISPIKQGVCLKYMGTLFGSDLPNSVPTTDKKCETKNCTPDVALNGDTAIVSWGYNYVYFMKGIGNADTSSLEVTGYFYSDKDVFDIATSGDITVVGVPEERAVHTFIRNADTGQWDHLNNVILVPPFDNATIGFGTALSLDGNVLVIGERGYEDDHLPADIPSPSVYIFRWNGNLWNMEARLTPDVENYVKNYGTNNTNRLMTTNEEDEDESFTRVLGHNVAVKGNMIAVADSKYGKWGKNKGGVWTYEYDPASTSWRQVHGVIHYEAECERHFGLSLALTDGGDLFIACPRRESWSGAVYFYTRTGPGCSYELHQTIKSSLFGQTNGRYFGYMDQIAVDGSGLAIGSIVRDKGKVFFFTREGDEWKEVAQISTPDKDVEFFGYEVALSSNVAVVNSQKNAHLYLIGDCDE